MDFTSGDFGEGFAWGVASSAYQAEGAYLNDNKGLSIWDVFSALPNKIKGGHNSTVASDFYNRYIQDIILMQYMNIRNFRFSLSWPRLFPEGVGEFNDSAVDHYNELIDFCLEMGMTINFFLRKRASAGV